jgi:hypothetical protein
MLISTLNNGTIATWLGTQDQLDVLPEGTEYATLSDILSGDPYTGTPFDGCRVVVTRDGLDFINLGFDVCPANYPNGTAVYEDGNTLLDWKTVPAPVDPLPGVSDEAVFKAIDFRGLYTQLSQRAQQVKDLATSTPTVKA